MAMAKARADPATVSGTCRPMAYPTPKAVATHAVTGPAAWAAPLAVPATLTGVFQALEAERTLFLQSVRCREDKRLPMADFIADVSAFLDAHTLDRFVLDLRHNTGGSSALITLIR